MDEPKVTWDDRLLAIVAEADIMEETPESMSKKMFRNNLIGATLSICDLATRSVNERVRLQAAQYVVERNLGRLQDATPEHMTDPLYSHISEFVKEIPDDLDAIT